MSLSFFFLYHFLVRYSLEHDIKKYKKSQQENERKKYIFHVKWEDYSTRTKVETRGD